MLQIVRRLRGRGGEVRWLAGNSSKGEFAYRSPSFTQTRGRAVCPVCNVRPGTLAIADIADGKALLRCAHGCDFRAVVASLGLKLRDLFLEPSPATSERREAARVDVPLWRPSVIAPCGRSWEELAEGPLGSTTCDGCPAGADTPRPGLMNRSIRRLGGRWANEAELRGLGCWCPAHSPGATLFPLLRGDDFACGLVAVFADGRRSYATGSRAGIVAPGGELLETAGRGPVLVTTHPLDAAAAMSAGRLAVARPSIGCGRGARAALAELLAAAAGPQGDGVELLAPPGPGGLERTRQLAAWLASVWGRAVPVVGVPGGGLLRDAGGAASEVAA